MKESEIERFFVKECKKKGWLALKFVSPSMSGLPDRIVFTSGGQVSFVELKAKEKQARPLQTAVHRMLHRFGFCVYVIDSKTAAKECLEIISKKVGDTK